MSDTRIQRVGVLGAGQIGHGIAEVSVRAGVAVTVYETTDALVIAGQNRIVKSLERGVSAGKVTERERDRGLSQLTFTTDLNDPADRQLVIEAIVEDEAVKAGVFAKLDEVITDPDAVLASNTSSIPIMKLVAATKNPQRVLVPALLQPRAGAAAGRVGQHAGHRRSRGRPHRRVCRRRARQTGGAGRPGHPQADRRQDVRGIQRAHYGPPPLLLQMVEAGMLGKKSGQGFYAY